MRSTQTISNALKKLEKHRYAIVWVVLLYAICACIIAWPLPMHMNGFLLPQEYPNISHSDSIQHINKIGEANSLIEQHKLPIITDATDVSHNYIWLGLFFVELLKMNPVVFHNLFFLMCMIFSGLCMYLLAKELTNDYIASILAGFIYMSSYYIPYAYFWGHSNTMQIPWIPLIFYFVEKLLKHQRIQYALALGVSIALQLFASSYNFIHLSFLLPFYLLLRTIFVDKKTLLHTKKLKLFGIAILTALVISSPYLISRIQTQEATRTLAENMMPDWRMGSLGELFNINQHLYVGTIQAFLFIIGIFIINTYRKEKKKWPIPYLLMAFFVLICMLGPISIFAPYYWLYSAWPYFNHLRVPFRMYPFFLMGISLIASLFLVEAKKYFKQHQRILIVLIVIVCIFLLQIFVSPWLSNYHMYYLN
jgi:hypothetical protein